MNTAMKTVKIFILIFCAFLNARAISYAQMTEYKYNTAASFKQECDEPQLIFSVHPFRLEISKDVWLETGLLRLVCTSQKGFGWERKEWVVTKGGGAVETIITNMPQPLLKRYYFTLYLENGEEIYTEFPGGITIGIIMENKVGSENIEGVRFELAGNGTIKFRDILCDPLPCKIKK